MGSTIESRVKELAIKIPCVSDIYAAQKRLSFRRRNPDSEFDTLDLIPYAPTPADKVVKGDGVDVSDGKKVLVKIYK